MPKVDGVNIQRVQRQHSSAVVVIPIAVRRALEIEIGDYIIFSSHSGTGVVEFSKFKQEGKKDVKHKRRASRKDKGGGS